MPHALCSAAQPNGAFQRTPTSSLRFGNAKRGASVSTSKVTRLLVLDLVDFRLLMARHPDLAETIDAEAKRRERENQ